MAGNTAPADGVIRRTGTAQARHVRKGGRVPEGWTFEAVAPATATAAEEAPKTKGKAAKAQPAPAETTEGKGPDETA